MHEFARIGVEILERVLEDAGEARVRDVSCGARRMAQTAA